MECGPLPAVSERSIDSEPSKVHGGWPAARFLIAVGFVERLGFNGVQSNLILYLTGPLGLSTAAAAAVVNAWSGTVSVLPLLGALAGDSRLGRYRAVLAAGVLYLLSLGMLTVSSMTPTPHPQLARCQGAATICSLPQQPPPPPPTASSSRIAFFYAAIYLLALAQGFHKPCSEALGADQFDQSDPDERASRSSFFNWLHFSMSWGYAVSATAVSYLQDNVGWAVGFGVCWATFAVSLAFFLLGTGTYRIEHPVEGNPFAWLTVTVQIWTARAFPRKDDTGTARCRLLTPEAQEDKGVIVKLLPIWLTSVVFAVVSAQVTTLFTKQSGTMDRRLDAATGLTVPPAALQCFVSFAIIVFIPVYDRAVVPLARRFTGLPTGITMLQRIGAGMALSSLAMVVAALVEDKRLRIARDAGLLDRPDLAVPMSLWWVVPQYVLIGLANVFALIGLEEFFYDQVPDELRSIGLALCVSIIGAGSYASGMLVSAIDWATRSRDESWFSDNLNRAHLDYFFWVLGGLGALEVVIFLFVSSGYVYRNRCDL